MHIIYQRFCVLALLAILSVGAFSHSEIRSKKANVTLCFRETEMDLANTTVHWISPPLFRIEVGDSHNACELSRIFNQELTCNLCSHVENEESICQQRGLNVPVRSPHGPLSTSEPTREIKLGYNFLAPYTVLICLLLGLFTQKYQVHDPGSIQDASSNLNSNREYTSQASAMLAPPHSD
jgi:hypothetical protein